MSLFGILNIGNSALAAQQAALQVTGNNLANAADPNYTREVANLNPSEDSPNATGQLAGSGVTLTSISRQIDQALEGRLRSANSDQSTATTLQNYSGQVQSVFNALSGNGLSDQLNTFFNDWSALAAKPASTGLQQVVVQDGQNVATTFNTITSGLSSITTGVQQAVQQGVSQVNQLSSDIASLNRQIVQASNGGTNTPNSLLDQRDADLTQLSQLVNIQTVAQPTGSVNVFVGSEPLIDGTTASQLNLSTVQNNGHTDTSVTFPDGSTADITGGALGGLFQSQNLIDTTTNSVDALATSLTKSLNNIYSNGQSLQGFTSTTATNAVSDPTQPLDNSLAGLTSPPVTGNFTIHLTDTTTNLPTSSLVSVTENGTAGDTSLNSLAASLNSISGVQATITNGKLTIQSTNPNVQISFGQDTSGVLNSLGINTFFTGSDAGSIGVNSQLVSNASLLNTSLNGSGNDNLTAQAIANLGDAPQAGLNGSSLSVAYGSLIANVGAAASGATTNAAAATSVQQTLTAQQQTLGGVSTDEEAINMLLEQRAYQGAARLISTIDQMMQTLLAIT